MKLIFSPSSPFVRKVRIAAIELGLIDKIAFLPTTVAPGQPNDDYARITPLKKLPALILDNGDVILDSYVIAEYLDELAGGGKLIPASGPTRWKVKSDHSLIQGMLDSMLLCRYEKMVRPQGCNGRHGPTTIGTGLGAAWHISRSRLRCCRAHSVSPRSAWSACSA